MRPPDLFIMKSERTTIVLTGEGDAWWGIRVWCRFLIQTGAERVESDEGEERGGLLAGFVAIESLTSQVSGFVTVGRWGGWGSWMLEIPFAC